MLLENKSAVVTGAAQGIGKAIALALAKEGADIAVCDVNLEKASETAKEIESLGRIALACKLNVVDAKEVEENMNKILDKFKKIDILVNNAGITKDNLIIRMKEEEWDAVLNVNLKGTFNCLKAVSRHMMKERYGRIVNIASVIGLVGNAGQANYAASKAGVIGVTKSAAKELAKRNITVNAVAPGFIKTAMTDVLPESVKAEMLKVIPMARLGEPSDVANAVVFLVSESASYITGHVIEVDGGMVI